MNLKTVYIVAAKRTPIGSFGGKFAGLSATELGAKAIQGAMAAANIAKDQVDAVYMGNVVSANLGQAPARQAAVGAGIDYAARCTTVNKVCASGMKAIALGYQDIVLGDAHVVVSGGMESMSNIPFYASKMRWGAKYGHSEFLDGLQKDGLTDAYSLTPMGTCADATATKYEISREDQDRYAIQSYTRAKEATESGRFFQEIIPISLPQKGKDDLIVSEDEEFRNVNFDKIPGLRAAFSKDGTVTAANASTINDGATALILCDEDYLKAHNLKPLAKILAYGEAEHEPEWFTTAPVKAAAVALKKANLAISDIDFFEVNEAFAVVTMAFNKAYDLPESKVNINGGAVAIGHPLGCSGARIVCTLIHVLEQQNAKLGLAAICNGGGGASAIIIEKC